MIIETPFKELDTVTIKTSAGDEIIARYITDDTNTVTVEKPFAIVATQQGIGLGPFIFTVAPDTRIKLNKNLILFIHKTEAELAKQYMSSSSGIQLA